mmetsp:Transcript_60347/g.143794  ORF Transcript_60347/g.143794 Transcript_60347/m.143794 type:complete len:287 (+) Transcript_60347:111-971(+)|eukprot:CAMPEP_0178427220 /NCGR_PEP_ID=MMETSP0689_2-20121128/29631_1 /TAXON_ID=160604 /ORGANISM="Amphidinium massartii, Strain CS-259" /LENGTH=286 /DNA_ID=CAMNT_0020048917 /DNA_START=24 /DNA_END=884 /DNA_ORIENTATION=-
MSIAAWEKEHLLGPVVFIQRHVSLMPLASGCFHAILGEVLAYSVAVSERTVSMQDFTISKAQDGGWGRELSGYCWSIVATSMAIAALVRFAVVHSKAEQCPVLTASRLRILNHFTMLAGVVSGVGMIGVGCFHVGGSRLAHFICVGIYVAGITTFIITQTLMDSILIAHGVLPPEAKSALRWHGVRCVLVVLMLLSELCQVAAQILEVPLKPENHSRSSGFEVSIYLVIVAYWLTCLFFPSIDYGMDFVIQSVREPPPAQAEYTRISPAAEEESCTDAGMKDPLTP